MASTWKALTWHYARQALPMLAMMIFVMVLSPLAVKGLFILSDLTFEMNHLSANPQHYFNYFPLAFFFYLVVAFAAQDGVRKAAYPMPVSNGGLVAWQLILAMLFVAAQNVLVLLSYRQLFSIDWSIVEPTALMMVAVVLAHAVAWSLYDITFLRLLACGLVVAGFLWWCVDIHFPNGYSEKPERLGELSVPAWLTLAVILAASWRYCVHMIGRHRRGETRILTTSDDLVKKVDEIMLDWFSPKQPDFFNGHSALAWSEWRRGRLFAIAIGLAMAGIPVFGAIIGLNAGRMQYLEGCIAVSCFLAIGTGLASGQVGSMGIWSHATTGGMSTFLGTSPISDRDLSRIVQWNMFRSSGLMWLVVITVGLSIPAVAMVNADSIQRLAWLKEVWLYREVGIVAIPIAIGLSSIAAWTIAGTFGSLMMTGRTKLINAVVFTLMMAVLIGSFVIRFLLPENIQLPVLIGSGCTFSIATVVLCVTLFVKARQRDFIGPKTIPMAAGIWLAESAILIGVLPFAPISRAIICGFATLSVVPLAASPLAVSYNRHR